MREGSDTKSALFKALHEFSMPDDLDNPKSVQSIRESGLIRTAFRCRCDFALRAESRISLAIRAMEDGDIEPIKAIERELAAIGIELEFSSGGEDYHLGDPVLHIILLHREELDLDPT